MSTFLIGDVQGCYDELQDLLQHIAFNPQKDRLGFVGDLVNRGPQSLEVLRFITQLNNPMVVLGNHDIYALILGYGLCAEDAYQHTLHNVLNAPDKIELLDWLRQQPLVYQENNTLLVHAGLPPQWTSQQSLDYAAEVHEALRGPDYKAFLQNSFGNEPANWNPTLTGDDRLRYIVDAFLRIRLCDKQGKLDLDKSEHPEQYNTERPRLKPWFEWRSDYNNDPTIFFGHWAALNGECDTAHCHALDTGCAWGRSLTALRLEDGQRFSVPYKIRR